ncbi:hypothetical protein BASA83_000505 [Batrachochytrium salamandrivorans]|nr:hypothetical protein BASA83_000505 [Batrachochytrium salamandrivorans]
MGMACLCFVGLIWLSDSQNTIGTRAGFVLGCDYILNNKVHSKKVDTSGSDLLGRHLRELQQQHLLHQWQTAASTLTSASVLKVAAAAVAAAAASSHSSARRRSKATGISGTQHAVSVSVAAGAALLLMTIRLIQIDR